MGPGCYTPILHPAGITVKPVYSGHGPWKKVVTIGRWPLYGGQNEWGKALSVLTKVVFIERWPYYRVATIDRFHCTSTLLQKSILWASGARIF